MLPAGPRRMALVLLPEEGEALASWVDRLAADHLVPPGVIGQALGLQARTTIGAEFHPVFYGIVPTPVTLAHIRQATGIRPTGVQAMHLSRYAGTALDLSGIDIADERSVNVINRQGWALLSASRACPPCLAESGGVWQLAWRLGSVAVCPVHRVRLVEVCPRCGIRLRQGLRSRPRGLSKRFRTDPVLCGNFHGGTRCTQDVRDLPADLLPSALAAWQSHILNVANGQTARIGGQAVSAWEWFTALSSLAALIRFAAPLCPLVDDLAVPESARRELATATRQRSQGGFASALRTMPPSTELTIAVLAAVEPILSAASPDAVAAAMEAWVKAAVARRRKVKHNPLRHLPLPGPLAWAYEQAIPPLSRVAGRVRTVTVPTALGLDHIPQLLDEGDYADLVAAHLPGTAPASGRRLAALALARLAGAGSWAAAARALEMDAHRAARVSDVVVRRITDTDTFWQAIAQAAQRLLQRGPVDYAHRRRALAHLHKIPHLVLFAAYRPLGLPVTPRRQRNAAIWVWTALTGGDARDAPAYAADSRANTESVAENWRRFRTRLPPSVATALLAYGTDLLARHPYQGADL
ncbi:TniQ family protein [Streptomyces sp. H10-C2]|uniref:TniQ family protein n=1 Tax=unclassified Streptomyces TaxID=2593676 RepID=UPI0024BAC3D7|nr:MULTISPECIES: TniQ family protein [unclassified Streptomyces]MDJ0340440.1 TniQ family protein [Streptomyces sp. PH10-H1]MDJ0368112.1 TniQ family protein [Streptomyces sp. H10-C2]